MEINDELIDHLSYLAKLKFEGPEKIAIKTDLIKITGFMQKLSELNTDDLEPLIFMTEESGRHHRIHQSRYLKVSLDFQVR